MNGKIEWNTIQSLLSIFFAFVLVASCSGGDSGGDGENPFTENTVVKEGQFLDSAVAGLGYVSGDQSGITDNNGTYQYVEEATIHFSIGDIAIGKAIAKQIMTPLDLVEGASNELGPTVTNIARFLQTLDNDANPENGITITESVRTHASGISLAFDQDVAAFENDENVQTIVAELTSLTDAGVRPLISSQQALSHLNRTLLVHSFSHTSPQGVTVTGDVGIWMFTRQELSMDAIADWLGRTYENLQNKRLLEPINIIWVDFTATTQQEAEENIETFLVGNGFSREGYPLHSDANPSLHIVEPYLGYYANSIGEPIWREQHGTLEAWVDADHPAENNHGRIFPALEATSDAGDSVYLTTGSFSHESGCEDVFDQVVINPCFEGHDFVNFKWASGSLNEADGWKDFTRGNRRDVGNQYPLSSSLEITTAYHDGVRVFALYPFSVTITSPLNGVTFSPEDPISFEGIAVTADGVALPDDSLVWESDRDGQIGTSPSFTRSDLSVGTHVITLTATDEHETTGSDSVTISVYDSDPDNDGDGYNLSQGDCNDNDPAIHPNANEICGDGIDQDCNGIDLNCNTDSSILGTWYLSTVNGQQIAPGVFLRWSFTESRVTISSDLDCVEVFTYDTTGGVLRATSLISRVGSQCGGDDDDGVLAPFSISGNTLTVFLEDPEIDPPTATFVFKRKNK